MAGPVYPHLWLGPCIHAVIAFSPLPTSHASSRSGETNDFQNPNGSMATGSGEWDTSVVNEAFAARITAPRLMATGEDEARIYVRIGSTRWGGAPHLAALTGPSGGFCPDDGADGSVDGNHGDDLPTQMIMFTLTAGDQRPLAPLTTPMPEVERSAVTLTRAAVSACAAARSAPHAGCRDHRKVVLVDGFAQRPFEQTCRPRPWQAGPAVAPFEIPPPYLSAVRLDGTHLRQYAGAAAGRTARTSLVARA